MAPAAYVSPVYQDARSKNGEHCFNVRRGSFVETVRAATKAEADRLRKAVR